MISLSGSIAAGYFLETGKHQLALISGVFLVLPGIFDLSGAVAGALGAKVAHRLQAKPTPFERLRSILHALLFSLIVLTFSAVILSAFGAWLGAWLFEANFKLVFQISFFSCLIAAAIGFPLIILLTVFVWRRGLDPDNVIGPIETSIFDSLTILAVLAVIGMLK